MIVLLHCPCCQFLPEDLFLPPPSSSLIGGGGKEDDVDVDDGHDGHDVAAMPLSPIEAWKELQNHRRSQQSQQQQSAVVSFVLLVDTHGHAHLERGGGEKGGGGEEEEAESSIYRVVKNKNSDNDQDEEDDATTNNVVASLTCAVSPEDWISCLNYASLSTNRVAAVGVHPWYHDNLQENTWYEELEALIRKHPGCMVGEMGLCKQARFLRTYEGGKQAALQLQRSVFSRQLDLAAKYRRGVSVHCVNQQGVLLDILKERTSSSTSSSSRQQQKHDDDNGNDASLHVLLPPVIALHSFTGTAHHIKQLLQWEEEATSLKLLPQSQSQEQQPLLHFGFSHTVNYAMCSSEKSRRQGKLAVQTVPRNRLLAESDVHSDADVIGGTAGAVAYIAWALQNDGNDNENDNVINSLASVADLTRRNGMEFLKRAHE